MINRMMLSMVFVSLAVALANCGGKSSDGGGGTTTPPPADTSLKLVMGSIFEASNQAPLRGHTVAVYDHTAGNFRAQLVADNGAFQFALTDFIASHVYSMHLLDSQFNYMGAVTFSGQPAFTYSGGAGMDVGSLTLARSALGLIDLAGSDFNVTASGGFAASSAATTSLRNPTKPAPIQSATLGSELVVIDPATALQAFYRSATAEATYNAAIAQLSKIRFTIRAAAGTLTDSFLLAAGNRKTTFRSSDTDDATPQAAKLWSATRYQLIAQSSTLHSRSIFTLSRPDSDDTYVIRTRFKDGASIDVPMQLDRIIAMPPLVQSIDQGGGLTAVDYTTPSAENGLTVPVCRMPADLNISISAPYDMDGSTFAADVMSEVDVAISYYSSADGVLTQEVPSAGDFASPYDALVNDPGLAIGSSDWNPQLRNVRFTLSAAAASPHLLTIPSPVLLSSIATTGKTISHIRLLIMYKGSGYRSGNIFWVKNC